MLLFAGLTAYDTQKIKSMYAYVAGTDMMGKVVIMGALTLYLDFINMFTFLLQLHGRPPLSARFRMTSRPGGKPPGLLLLWAPPIISYLQSQGEAMKLLRALPFLLLAAPALAQPVTPSEHAWNALAKADVEAALDLIQKNHPGAASELGDVAFQQALQTARANTARRLPLVKDFGGHAALLNGLANDFRDGHIMSNPLLAPSRRSWAGLIMARSGGQWVVGAQDKAGREPDLAGARLLSCDGIDADRFARDRIGTFLAHPDIEADMAGRAPSLLLDDANPFVSRAVACRFQPVNGAAVDHKLQWRQTSSQNLQRIAASSYQPAQAGMSVSTFAGGHWIALENLSNDAARVVEQVRAQQVALRASPTVVIDLRGNSGGNSQFAMEIARALAGDARSAATETTASACTGMFWRASGDNARALRSFANALPADRAPEWQAQADALERAVADGSAFSPDLPACARQETGLKRRPPARLPASAMSGRLILVTDRACFSSCLMAADLFRRLGALHVGEATDMSTRYMEIRDIVLPSGLRTFSTLQKVAIGLGDFGPYAPQIAYPGALHETDKLKAWVAALPR